MSREILTVSASGRSARYEWTPTGFTVPSGSRINAQPFANNLPGLVPTGGNSGLFLKDDGTWATPSVGGAASGLTLAQLAPAPPDTIVGRYSAGSGAHQDLTPTQVATMLPAFTVTGKGIVPPPGTVAGKFLKDDGTWDTPVAAPGGGAPTMLAVGPSGAVQFNSGSGFGFATGYHVRGDYPSLTVQITGNFHVPTGGFLAGNSVRMLASGIDAGSTPVVGVATLVAQDASLRSLALASGLSNENLQPIGSGMVLGRLSGTGAPQTVSIPTLHAFAPTFTATKPGTVPQSGGGTTNFLRADGTWTTPPASSAVPSGIDFSVQFNNGGAFAGATGIRVGASGQAFFFGPSGPLSYFNPAQRLSANPTGVDVVGPLSMPTGVANFQALTVASGIGNAYLDPIGSGLFKGRISGTGAVQDVALQTMLAFAPTFTAAKQGVVPPSGGGTDNYLRADGSWAVPPGGSATQPSGPAGAVQFRGAAGFDGATGIAVVASGQAMAFGPSAPAFGTLRFTNDSSLTWQHPNGFGMDVVRVAGDGVVNVGSPSGTELDLHSSSVVDFNIAGVPLVHRWSKDEYRMASGTQIRSDQSVKLDGLASSGTIDLSTNSTLRAQVSASGLQLFHGLNFPTGVPRFGHLSLGSGITNALMAPMGSGTVKANLTGTGTPSDVPIATLLAFAPTFTSTRAGVVPNSDGAATSFLAGDGVWRAPSGGHQFPPVGGATNAQLAVMATGTVKANLSGNATPSDVAVATLFAFSPTFTATRTGDVPASGGGTTNYLRADGTWSTPPGQAGSPGGGLGAVQYHDGVGFGGGTGISITASGQALGFGVPSFLPGAGDIRAASGFNITANLPSGIGGVAARQSILDWSGGGASGVLKVGGASGILGTVREEVATGGSFEWLIGGRTGMALKPTGLDAPGLHINAKSLSIGHINGLPFDFNALKRGNNIPATSSGVPSGLFLYAPRGAASGANRYIVASGTMQASGMLFLRPTGARAGEVIRIERVDTFGAPLAICTPTGTVLHAMPSGTKSWADFMFTKPSGVNFELAGHADMF